MYNFIRNITLTGDNLYFVTTLHTLCKIDIRSNFLSEIEMSLGHGHKGNDMIHF